MSFSIEDQITLHPAVFTTKDIKGMWIKVKRVKGK
jgi:hypothetical protein